MSKLTMIRGKQAGEQFPLGAEVVVGREGGVPVDIAIADTKASRKHLKIVCNAGAHFLVDLGSRNGTLVNGKKVSRVRLKAGDRITIGQTEFEYDGEPQAAPAPPPAVTETMSQRVAPVAQRPAAEPAARKARKERFDPSVFDAGPREATGLFGEDLAQRSVGFQAVVAGGALLFLLVAGALAYWLTTAVIG